MAHKNLIAEIEQHLQIGNLDRAEQLLRSIRWSTTGIPKVARLNAVLALCKGNYAPAEKAFSDLAHRGDADSACWLAAMQQLLAAGGQMVSENLFAQVSVERLRRSPYLDYPLEVHIETLSQCNAACTFCPYPTLDRLGTRMEDALIDKIIDDLSVIPAELPFGIAPFKVNDPLIDRRIFDICTRINQRLPNAHLRLFTNGAPLTDTNIARIARLERLQHLWVSLNEHQAERYQQVMGIPLAPTLKCLDRLHAAVVAGDFHRPVIISRVRDRTDADHEFLAFVQARYPRFAISLLPHASWAGQMKDVEGLLPPVTGCTRWFELSIMSTGKVALCCMDGEGRHVIGDVCNDSAIAIYNQPAYRRLRESVGVRQQAAAPCHGCSL